MRRSLEVILGQRITFKGEAREASGPLVAGEADIDEVVGYAAAVRAKDVTGTGGELRGRLAARRVTGQAVGVDIENVGPGTPGH